MEELKEEIYEKDYSFQEEEPKEECSDKFFELVTNGGLLSNVGERLRSIPHYINPTVKSNYEECLKVLENLAKERHGYIKATIDYTNYEAFIRVKMFFFEFLGKEELKILNFLSEKADSVCFYHLPEENKIVLTVRFNYFQIFENIFDILEDEVEKIPELSNYMRQEYEKKRATEIKSILEDKEIYEKIKRSADTIEVTPEEWLSKFVELYEDNFDEIEKILKDTEE